MNTNLVMNINLYDLDEQGSIVESNLILRSLYNKAGIYIYISLIENEEIMYIGSTVNIAGRFNQHKYCARIHARELATYNTKFYNYVVKYG